MTRREEINQQAEEYRQPYRDGGYRLSSKDVRDAFEEGAEWADKTMIDKAYKWLIENMPKYINFEDGFIYEVDMADDFRKAMEEYSMRERKKPSQSWIERCKYEIENADRLLAERQEQLKKIREKKTMEEQL